MTVGQVLVNVLLIALVPVAVFGAHQREHHTVRRGLMVGVAAAAVVVVGLLLVRGSLAIRPGAMLSAVVITEEIAKLLSVAILLRYQIDRSPSSPAAIGWSVGAGFAATEHLLYATAIPAIIITRIATAGLIHLVTARLYSGALAPIVTGHASHLTRRPYSERRRSTSASGSRLRRRPPGSDAILLSVTVAAGVLLHIGYNLLARRLDQIPVLW